MEITKYIKNNNKNQILQQITTNETPPSQVHPCNNTKYLLGLCQGYLVSLCPETLRQYEGSRIKEPLISCLSLSCLSYEIMSCCNEWSPSASIRSNLALFTLNQHSSLNPWLQKKESMKQSPSVMLSGRTALVDFSSVALYPQEHLKHERCETVMFPQVTSELYQK